MTDDSFRATDDLYDVLFNFEQPAVLMPADDLVDWSDVDLDRYTVGHTYFSDDDLAHQTDEPPAVSTIPQLDRELAEQPWELAVSALPISNPHLPLDATDLTSRRAAGFDPLDSGDLVPQMGAGLKPLDSEYANLVIGRLRADWRRRGDKFDQATFELATRLGDLLAASGNVVEALVTYRTILERLGNTDPRAAERVAEHATAVIGWADLEPTTSVVAELRKMIQARSLEQRDDNREMVLDRLRSSAAQTVDAIVVFDDEAADRLRVTSGRRSRKAVADLEPTALTNTDVAHLQMANAADLNDPLPVSVLGEAILDTVDGLTFSAETGWRGYRHRTRFADHIIVRSPLSGPASYEHYVTAVLRAPLRSRPQVTVGDVMHYAGCFPENSKSLLEQWRQRNRLSDRHVVFNCPHLLRTRSENHDLDHGDHPAPRNRLSGLVVTSLGWGGAADIGALIARGWHWGFTAATRIELKGNRETTFGDYADRLDDIYQHTQVAEDLLRTSQTMLSALPHLPNRVYALDQPRGAVQALSALPELGQVDNPLPIVVITMDERRIKWTARHLLSQGGRFRISEERVQTRAAELHTLQADLVQAALKCGSAASPSLVVEMIDHLDDGYAEQHGNDPVDADFDCFADTATKVSDALESLAPGTSTGNITAGTFSRE